ncbi:hypothetical protein OYT13_11455 [Pandoraea sp. XJJ-1]|uniref:hypothetical protein n=1 Tax=Pandoraea sp. XJJ-1 TaxID=3002643 RepID=UPI0022821F72|nr:hypothetical protein [Pandoraea sp. XJJ-1]WAL84963.1 hypothetical protein OYT13_11455 [Pandoraea sp. XJJ-1]
MRAGNPQRLMIWDPNGEWGAFGRVLTDQREVVAAVKAGKDAGGFRIVYQPGKHISQWAAKFDWFCGYAFDIGDLCVVVDELGDVTEPSRAPDGWSMLSRKGRHKALTLFGAAQRPANIDKDFIGNSTMIHCCRLSYDEDRKKMARELNVSYDEVNSLKADEDAGVFEFLERNQKSGEVRRGKLTF